MSDYVVAVSSAHVGEFDYIEAGRLYYASDPIVKARPEFFTDDFESVPGLILGQRTAPKKGGVEQATVPHSEGVPRSGRVVEQATANPGEKRAASRK